MSPIDTYTPMMCASLSARIAELEQEKSRLAHINVDLQTDADMLTSRLAECYRQTGADPDGNEDWRLAEHAIDEVSNIRKAKEAAERQVLALQREHDAFRRELDALLRATKDPSESIFPRLEKAVARIEAWKEAERQVLALREALEEIDACIEAWQHQAKMTDVGLSRMMALTRQGLSSLLTDRSEEKR